MHLVRRGSLSSFGGSIIVHSVRRGVLQLRHWSHFCMCFLRSRLLFSCRCESMHSVRCWPLLSRVGGFLPHVFRWKVSNQCSIDGVHELRGRQVLCIGGRNGRVDVRGLRIGALLSGRSFCMHELLSRYLPGVRWIERLFGMRGGLLLCVDGLVVVRSVSLLGGAILERWCGRLHELWGRSVLCRCSGFVHVVSGGPVPRRDRIDGLCRMLGGPVQFCHRAFRCVRRSVLGGALLGCWRERVHSVRRWPLPNDDGRFIVLNLCRRQV